jgi:hypothetical protein
MFRIVALGYNLYRGQLPKGVNVPRYTVILHYSDDETDIHYSRNQEVEVDGETADEALEKARDEYGTIEGVEAFSIL